MQADWGTYWRDNTFDINGRVSVIRNLLKTQIADTKYVRLGGPHDGGYIMADDLGADDYLISMGVDTNIDFELDVAEIIRGMDMYDYSVDGPPSPVKNSRFFKEKVGSDVSLDQALSRVKEIAPESNALLKMDIEGSELEVLWRSNLSEFRQVALEGHWLFYIEDEQFFRNVVASLAKLRQTHTPVWVHANNNQPLGVIGACPVPNVIEALFLRTDSYTFQEVVNPFEGLEHRNDVNFPEIGLSFP